MRRLSRLITLPSVGSVRPAASGNRAAFGVTALVYVACAASFVFPSESVRAEPTLEVRARASLELHPSRSDDGGTRVRAVLRDDIGSPIASARIELSLRDGNARCGVRSFCVTDRNGTCETRLDGCAGAQTEGVYEGTDAIDGARVEVPVLVHAAEPRVTVRLPAGTTIDLEAERVVVEVAIDGVSSMPARATLVDELGHTVLHRSLEARSVVRFEIAPHELGPPGMGAIVATVHFDDESQASGRIMVVRRLRSSLRLTHRRSDFVATLRDTRGAIADAVISLHDGDDVIGSSRTDARGRARFRVERLDVARSLFASYQPNDPSRSAARSSRVVLAPTPSRTWIAYTPLLTLALAFGVLALVLRREPRPEVVPAARREPPPLVEVAKRRHLVASESRVVLHVIAREDGAELTTARVGVAPDGGNGADAELGFAREHGAWFGHTFVSSGTFTIVIDCEGRAPETLRIRVPHRGEWSEAIVRLETTRAYARRAIDVVARAAATDDDAAEMLTVREAAAELGPSEDLGFVGDTETLVYGSDLPRLDAAREIVARGQARAARPPRP